jgi:hypothetical protein
MLRQRLHVGQPLQCFVECGFVLVALKLAREFLKRSIWESPILGGEDWLRGIFRVLANYGVWRKI